MKHILKIKRVVNVARMYVSRNDTNKSRNRVPDNWLAVYFKGSMDK